MEQSKFNEALRNSELHSHRVLDDLLEGCQIIGFDWSYIYLNHTAEMHNRRSNEELLGNRYMDMWPGIEGTAVFRLIKQTLDNRVSNHFENEFLFPNGVIGWFDLSIQPVPEGVFILSIDITERKNVENALRENKEKYRLIADNSDDWIYWVAPDGHLNYVSPACERVTGYSPEEFSRQPELIHGIVLEADQERVRHHTQIATLNDTPHNLEFRIITKTGEIRWINHSCSPIFNDKDEYLGRRGTNRNITELKRHEEQLFESEFRFSKLYENGPFGMVIADKDFRFKKVNPEYCIIMGYSEAEMLDLTFKDLSLPEDLNNDMPFIHKLINKEISVYKTEKRYIRKDKQVIWGSLTVISTYDSEGQFLYNLGLVEDITRRKQVEEELEKSENDFRLLAEAMPQIVWVTRPDGWNIYFNQQWVDYTGLSLEESYGNGWNKPFHPEDQQKAWDSWQNATKNNGIYAIECRLRRLDGVYRWWLIRGIPILDSEQNILKWFGTCTDIHELKQAEEKLQLQLDELMRWQKVTLNREERIQNLKGEVNELLAILNKPARYHNQNL